MLKHLPILIVILLLANNQILAQELVSSQQPEATENALFGWASAAYVDWAIVTAPQKDKDGVQSVGAAYLYHYSPENGFEIKTEITPDGLPPLSNFGISTAMTWDLAAIGSLGDQETGLFSGAVYLYNYFNNDFIFAQKLKASDQKIGDQFGYSLSFSEYEYLAVGAYQADGVENKSGAVYIYSRTDSSGWMESQKLIAKDGKSNDFFGHTLQFLDENHLAIGAYNADGAAERSGAVYIFTRNVEGEWIQEAKLFDPEGKSSDVFGYSLSGIGAISVPTKQINSYSYYGSLFIGAPGYNHDDLQSGAVFIFKEHENGEWSLDHTLVEIESGHNDHFGISIAHKVGLYIGANRSGYSNEGKIYKYNIYWDYLPEYPIEIIPFAGSDSKDNTRYHGSKITTNSDIGYSTTIITASPYTTVNGLKNAGKAYFYYTYATDNETELEVVEEYKLEQNYPNPFNPSTTINYQLPENNLVELRVFDMAGREIAELVNSHQTAGKYQVTFNAHNLASGVYVYRLNVGNQVFVKKMLLIK